MKLSDFDYTLPPDRIAQTPVEPRDSSRLLVLDRKTGELQHSVFSNLAAFLDPGDLLVINKTRVLPARIFAEKIPTGGKVELLLLNRREPTLWEVLVGGKRVGSGKKLSLPEGLMAEVEEVLDGPRRLVRFNRPVEGVLDAIGEMPLPPYIHEQLIDQERYQTVYAREVGSAAAPTAGLHFTPELIESLKGDGIRFAEVTLHVGLDTFAPVTEEDVSRHQIHTEWCSLSEKAAETINHTKQNGGKVIAIGTTSVRTLEFAAFRVGRDGNIKSFQGATDLFILPGYSFQVVDAMVTNFHLPRSTLLMLVSAFAGKEKIFQAYQTAIEQHYRFYSFGDAMLIL